MVIKPLITEAPVQEIENIPTITIEKLLVDLFTDDVIFSAYQGKELSTIYQEVFNAYTVKYKKATTICGSQKTKAKTGRLFREAGSTSH